jgi:hypothetical protein
MKTKHLLQTAAFAVVSAFSLQPSALVYAASWVNTGSMSATRYAHTATLLPNGKLLVAGGRDYNRSPSYLSSTELYDPATGSFTSAGQMTTARALHVASLLPSGKVLVVGGSDVNANSTPSAELYDPFTGAWTATSPLNDARGCCTVTLLPNGKVLVAGGRCDSGSTQNILTSAELFDPVAGTWARTGPMHTNRQFHTATLLPNGKVLVTGGGSSGGYLFSAELYDPATGTWTTTGTMTTNRISHTATLLPSGKVLVAGGDVAIIKGGKSAELYDPTTEMWTPTGWMTTNRQLHTATLLPNGKVLVAGGYGYGTSGALSRAELFDPATGLWTATTALNQARFSQTATVLASGNVLVTGGFEVTTLSSAELYDWATPASTAGGALRYPRSWHEGTLLASGKALIAGGLWTNGWILPYAEVYDPATDTWANTVGMMRERQYHTLTLLPNGGVLAAGGLGYYNLSQYYSEVYIPALGYWTSANQLRTPRWCHTATLLPNGKALLVGGYADTNSPRTLNTSAELYDPAAGYWTLTGSLNIRRALHTATLLPNGKVLVAGGDGAGKSAELYEPGTGMWTPTGPMTTNRWFHTATLLPNGKVLVAGGYAYGASGELSTAELYDPATGLWTATAAMANRREYHRATLLPNGKVLVTGGGALGITSAELYDPATGTWSAGGALVNARHDHTATLLPNGKVLLAGGGDSGRYTSELYDAGLGSDASWQPQIATCISPLSLGGRLALTGSRFRGISEASGGNFQDSPSDYPVVQLRSVESEQTLFLLSTNWSASSFISLPLTNFPLGWALATMFVNGISSTSSTLLVTTAPGRLILDDIWADGTRTDTSLPDDTAWFANSAPSLTNYAPGSMTGIADSGGPRVWLTYFTTNPAAPVDLAVGEQLKATLVFIPTDVATFAGGTGRGLRVGLFNFADGGTRASADGWFVGGSAGSGTNVTGYLLNQCFYTVFQVDAPMQLWVRTNLPSGSLMGTLANYLQVGDSGPTGYSNAPGFVSGTQYTLEFSAARTAANSVDVSARITGGGLDLFNSAADAAYACHRFDCFAIRAGSVTDAAASFTFTEFKVEVLPVTPSMRFATGRGELLLINGTFQMHLENVPSTGTVVIEASTNLVRWVPVFTNTTTTNVLFCPDPQAGNYVRRFYRAIWTP